MATDTLPETPAANTALRTVRRLVAAVAFYTSPLVVAVLSWAVRMGLNAIDLPAPVRWVAWACGVVLAGCVWCRLLRHLEYSSVVSIVLFATAVYGGLAGGQPANCGGSRSSLVSEACGFGCLALVVLGFIAFFLVVGSIAQIGEWISARGRGVQFPVVPIVVVLVVLVGGPSVLILLSPVGGVR